MHDGEFVHGGKIIKIKKVVYMFAGGTAPTHRQFTSRQNEAEFRAAKGPDFVTDCGDSGRKGPERRPSGYAPGARLRHEMTERVKREGKGEHKFEPEFSRRCSGLEDIDTERDQLAH